MENARHKIVLVDDNLATLNQGKNLLKPIYRVYTVQSAATLFENLENDIPDMILLDVEMPEMDGFETIKRLKADARYKHIPVIFLTSKSDEESEREGFRLGAVDYITKPFSEPLLLKRISNQILYDRIQSAVRDYARDFESMSYELTKETRRAQVAEESSKAKSLFLAKMSHEIRTPMNSIIGFLELAQSDSIPEKTRGYLEKIQDSAENLLTIINDVLDISKIESGKMELERIPFDLQDIIDHCLSVIMPKAEAKSLELRCVIDPSAKRILLGDPIKLRQAFLNILSNAIKFTETGKIDFRVSVLNSGEKDVTIRFEIKDSGIGIEPEQIATIFTPFMQADNSITRKFGGTGLGLAITKNYIEMMGGVLDVESKSGTGSSFSFELKFDIADEAELLSFKAIPSDFKKPNFEGEVLICEDNAMNQQVICEHLAKVGLKTVVAQNGEECIDIVSKRAQAGEKPFDLIFMDIYMPIMGGLDAASKIRDLGVKTPIVVMTANIMSSDLEIYKAKGMSGILGKPFRTLELWECLLKYFTPVSYSQIGAAADADADDEKMMAHLKQNFLRSNQTVYSDIVNAIEEGDVTCAHRLAHTLKSNAGQIGEIGLQKAAAAAEAALADGAGQFTDEKRAALKAELEATLERLNSMSAPTVEETVPQSADGEKSKNLLDRLAPMLKNRNPECMNMLGEIRAVAGMEELARHVEKFDFKLAEAELDKLRRDMILG